MYFCKFGHATVWSNEVGEISVYIALPPHYGNQGIKIRYHPGTKLHPKHDQGILRDAKKQKL